MQSANDLAELADRLAPMLATGPDLPQAAAIDEQALAEGRRLFARPVQFLKGVVAIDQLPATDLPEVAFAGRSNVGKSSLINAVAGRRELARTSKTPGRTQELNFFNVADRLLLVDLPGYGYAAAPKAKVLAWNQLIRDYLRGRPALARVLVLIDIRHGVKPIDREILTLLGDAAMVWQLVLTKCDLVSERDLWQRIREAEQLVRRQRGAHPEVLATSARTHRGIDALRAALAAIAEAARQSGLQAER